MRTAVIIPARNEEHSISTCLRSVIAQHDSLRPGQSVQIVLAANGCSDKTADAARALIGEAAEHGIDLTVLDLAEGGKTRALNAAEAETDADALVYLDSDVTIEAGMLAALGKALDTDQPRYASGTPELVHGDNWVTRKYSETWKNLPFVADGVSGCGLYATNKAGRARWDAWPEILSDDKFIRLNFEPDERVQVSPRFFWPVPEGFSALVRARTRWCKGNTQVEGLYPDLQDFNDSRKMPLSAAFGLLLKRPVSLTVFTTIYFIAKVKAAWSKDAKNNWSGGAERSGIAGSSSGM
ncbi:MAG: glycosyltransferase family 2 protein [Pseudomonadota bacterium]